LCCLGCPFAQLDKLFNWYNGTLFAYGQTGTGKTHSMLGPEGARRLQRAASRFTPIHFKQACH
jgi:chromosomal replication initiation ATPase DnaA